MIVLEKKPQPSPGTVSLGARKNLLKGLVIFGMVVLVFRAVYLQSVDKEFLQKEGDVRHISSVSMSAYRGKIVDRNNEPLAISIPMESVTANPQVFVPGQHEKIRLIGNWLGVSKGKINRLLNPNYKRRFVYLKRLVMPELVKKIKALDVDGIEFKREFKRFYPAGAVSAHIVGFTDIDDNGLEGLERGYDHILKGEAGKKRVIRDGRRRVIKDIENIREPISGQDLMISIDQRLQYIAFKALQSAVSKHKAISASLIVLDANNGEVLAAVSQPAYNPNKRSNVNVNAYRNRTFLDVYEPGSTVKPFVVLAALDGQYIDDNVEIETHGYYRVGRNLVRDTHNYKTLDLTGLLKKSSNIAASKVALAMPADYFWQKYSQLGFGTSANIGFPGEASGSLQDFQSWGEFEQATLSYGYGVSSSTLQLARAYTALADDGVLHSVSLIKREEDDQSQRVFSRENTKKVRKMLEQVVTRTGTAYQARVDGYRIAGKTGTVKKASVGGYSDNQYIALFVGMAPASDPKYVIAVMIDEPSAGKYYGGQVAAPVFSQVMAGALRLYGVLPDQEDTVPVLLANKG